MIVADTPDIVGFSESFQVEFDALLQELSGANTDGKALDFCVFRRTRDFQKLPDAVPLTKTSRFFKHLSNLYSIMFHDLGGDALVAAVKEGDADVYIRSCIRTLFLKSKQVRADLWITPMFDQELKKATATLAAEAHKARTFIRKLRERIFDPKTGTIQLDLSLEDPRSLGTRKLFALWKPLCMIPLSTLSDLLENPFEWNDVKVWSNARKSPPILQSPSPATPPQASLNL